jgi:tRNA threonylcarbamoyladenosine biosynthesis protein TsaE
VTVHHQTILGTRPESRTLRWRSEAECAAMAAQLASKPAIRDAFIALDGPLGAGKTTFVRHLLRALGVRGHIKSPTYAVMEPYELPGLAIAHLDFYRFDDASEFVDAGLRDVFERPGLRLAEWPGRAGAALPQPDLRVELELLDENERRVKLIALSPIGQELLP